VEQFGDKSSKHYERTDNSAATSRIYELRQDRIDVGLRAVSLKRIQTEHASQTLASLTAEAREEEPDTLKRMRLLAEENKCVRHLSIAAGNWMAEDCGRPGVGRVR
jgi:hypothetical protein